MGTKSFLVTCQLFILVMYFTTCYFYDRPRKNKTRLSLKRLDLAVVFIMIQKIQNKFIARVVSIK